MKIEVIGKGNVGTQFANIFKVSPIASRSLEGMSDDADLYIIAVSDSAVKDVANKFPKVKGIVLHTSGSVPMSVLSQINCHGYGVMYPFQTLSKQRLLSPDSIPLLIEADRDEIANIIISAAKHFGFDKIDLADSEKRRKVHLAGTFASNFTNAMITVSHKILSFCDIDPEIVNPLIAETIEKIKHISPVEAQTGPAIREDYNTIEKHLKLLEELCMIKEKNIYSDISKYIIDTKPASKKIIFANRDINPSQIYD